jgi:hypothetical protein
MNRVRVLTILGFLLALPVGAAAQAGVALLGRVYDAESGAAVENAIVTLEGFGSTLTDSDGGFRFRGVETGSYTLRVEAFSYAEYSQSVTVDGDTSVEVPLGSSPLPLDSIVVEAGTVDYHGRVRDPERDFLLVDAEVLVRGREPVWTDSHGRFNLDDLPEAVPVNLSVRAFGYLPIDTTFVPDDEERYDFDLARDAFAEAMMNVQVRRLGERAGGRLMTGWLLMDRERIIRYAGSHTAESMLQFEWPGHILGRIQCTFIDERQIDLAPGAMGKEIRSAVLMHTLPEEIERVEMLTFDNLLGRPTMLQIYTRSFIMAMATQDVSLRTPNMLPLGNGYTCF